MRGGAFLNGKEGRVGFRKNNTIMMKNFKDITDDGASTFYSIFVNKFDKCFDLQGEKNDTKGDTLLLVWS